MVNMVKFYPYDDMTIVYIIDSIQVTVEPLLTLSYSSKNDYIITYSKDGKHYSKVVNAFDSENALKKVGF